MSSGTLEVTVMEGRNLKDKDTFGHNDPSIELYLDKECKQRTTTIHNSSSPLWNETFHFNLREGEDQLHIKVYAEDKIGNDAISSVNINLEKIRQAGGYLNEWFRLPAYLGLRSHGEIHLILRLTETVHVTIRTIRENNQDIEII